MLTAAKSSLTILMIICRQKQSQKKYLIEKCQSEHYQQLSFKYFVKVCLILKLLPKVSLIQTTISRGALKHQWVNKWCQENDQKQKYFNISSSGKLFVELISKHRINAPPHDVQTKWIWTVQAGKYTCGLEKNWKNAHVRFYIRNAHNCIWHRAEKYFAESLPVFLTSWGYSTICPIMSHEC